MQKMNNQSSQNENGCTDGQFVCSNSLCVNETLLCNGRNDCGDFSDETRCSKSIREPK